MLILLKAIINQEPLQVPRRHINWEAILKVSDFQNIISIVYHAILGLEKEISEECTDQFYQKYKRELLLHTSYGNAKEVIMWQLERYRIHALLLSDVDAGELYPRPGMSYPDQIEFLVEEKNLPQIYRLMRDMDYEQQEDRLESGNVFTRVPGIRVVFFNEIPIANKIVRRTFSEPLKRCPHIEQYEYIHILSEEDGYLYRIGRLVEFYVAGILRMRGILDFWQYQRQLGGGFRRTAVEEILEKAGWTEFVRQIGVLATLWLEDGVRQQYGTALELEEYIITRRQENKHLDRMLLPFEKARPDFYWRSREDEWAHKKREWMFPPREYMIQFYPILERFPFLLVFCWIGRDFRFLRIVCKNRGRKVWLKVRVTFLDIKEKLRSLLPGMKDAERTNDMREAAEVVDIENKNKEEAEVEKDVEEIESQK